MIRCLEKNLYSASDINDQGNKQGPWEEGAPGRADELASVTILGLTFLLSTRVEAICPLSFRESITHLIDAIEKLCGLQRLTVKQPEKEVTDCNNY